MVETAYRAQGSEPGTAVLRFWTERASRLRLGTVDDLEAFRADITLAAQSGTLPGVEPEAEPSTATEEQNEVKE